ncbi:MAG: M20/M25/M40 family metallo-hydrolase [Gammaproteobacteria bacterium]|nr:M20/M25/M40 family metallo-hydrolase [Gammaproteobacteria bacterium]
MANPSPRPRGGAAALWATLLALLAFTLSSQWLYQPPAPLPANAPAGEFSAQRAAQVLDELVGDDAAHPIGSAADARIRARIIARLHALGIPAETRSGWVCDRWLLCGWTVNVVARIAGSEPAGGAILLAAHYDSVPSGPGAGDDGIGVASVLEIARILKLGPPPRHPVVLLINEGEEAGLLGARMFVDRDPEARAVKAAINVDARGDSGPSLMFETGPATDFSIRLFARAAQRPTSNSLYYFIYKLLPNDTDFTVFKAAGYEGLNFALIGDVERYHTPLDRLALLDRGSLQHQGQNALASLQAFAGADLAAARPAGAVFFDVFGRTLLHWPAAISAAIGLGLAALLLLALWPLARAGVLGVRAVARALAMLLGGWLAAAVIAALLLALLRAAGAVPPAQSYSWAAHPFGMHLACLALALLAPFAAQRLVTGLNAWAWWCANVLWLAALALLCSLAVAELSFLFLAPLVASIPAALLARRALRADARAAVPGIVAALPVLGAAFTLVPSLLLTYPALGADAWPIITAVAGLVVLGLAPLLAQAGARSVRAYGLAALLVLLAGVTATLLAPPYSTRMPQRTLLWYALDADRGRAHWVLQPDSKRDPPRIDFAATSAAPLPATPVGVIASLRYAAAPRLAYAAPELQPLPAAPGDPAGLRRVHLRSMRAAPELQLAFPRGFPLKSVQVLDGARAIAAHPWRGPDGTSWLELVGLGPDGVDLAIDTGAPAAAAPTATRSLRLADRSYGLPPAGAALRAPPPTLTTPSQDGDLTIVYRSVELGAAR